VNPKQDHTSKPNFKMADKWRLAAVAATVTIAYGLHERSMQRKK
jgi:hypothetical protein